MPRDAFLLNLKTAAELLSPAVQVDGIRLDPEHISHVLRYATIWLTERAVEGFDPADFPELTPEERAQLQRNVETFRAVAEGVAPGAPASQQQIQDAMPAFVSILTAMRPYLEGFQVYHALKRQSFPEYVRDFAVRVGEDSTGDPATWIWVIVRDDVAGRDFIRRVPDLQERINIALRRSGIGLYPYVSFRTESEQEELESNPVQ